MDFAVEAVGSYWVEKYVFESRSDSSFNSVGDGGDEEEGEGDSDSDSESEEPDDCGEYDSSGWRSLG